MTGRPFGSDDEAAIGLIRREVEHDTQAMARLRRGTHVLHWALRRRQILRPGQRRVGEIDDDAIGTIERKDVVFDRAAQFDDEPCALRT